MVPPSPLRSAGVTGDLLDGLRDLVRAVAREEVARALAEVTNPSEYLTTAEAATHARVEQGTIRRWIRAGRLTGHRSGRKLVVRRADLERLMRGDEAGELSDDQIDAMARRLAG